MKDKGKSNLSKILCTAGIILGMGLIFIVFSSGDNGSYLRVLPFLIFLLCPIMHIFMHKGHHKKDHQQNEDGGTNSKTLE